MRGAQAFLDGKRIADPVTRAGVLRVTIDDPSRQSRLSSDAEAVRTGDGLFSRSTGNPSVPRWLGSHLMSLFLTTKKENEKYAKHVRGSAGITVFVSDVSEKEHWVETGRCYQRCPKPGGAQVLRTV